MVRDVWATKYGLILAMAGNAIGLGNFLRFPVQAASNGGGAFMIPYLICFVLIGIPLMWIEWGIGRRGGQLGKGTTYGISKELKAPSFVKISCLLGVWVPLVVSIYYIYIESWTLGYSIKALVGDLESSKIVSSEKMGYFTSFLNNYTGFNKINDLGLQTPSIFSYLCLVITVLINYSILKKGISAGIEKFVKIAMPLLLIMSLFLAIYVLTIKTDVSSAILGLNFLWNPDLSYLSQPKVWIAAAGQVFFTLSLGFGAIVTYASFIKNDEDIALSGLTSATLNEIIEVVFGGSIVIPAAVAFLGISGAVLIANSGAFSIGFISMPAIFDGLPYGNILCFIWFFLLFVAGITSSIGIIQPAITFFNEELNFSRIKSVNIVMLIVFFFVNFIVFFPNFLSEFDFWAGTIMLIVLALLEVYLYNFFISKNSAVEEINRNSLIKIPKFFDLIFKYLLPIFLIVLLVSWVFSDIYSSSSSILKNDLWTLFSRLILILIFILLLKLVRSNR